MRILILLAILLCIDLYVFQGIRVLTSGREAGTQRVVHSIFWMVTALAVATIAGGQIFDWHTWPRVVSTYLFALVVIVYLSKLFVVVFLLTDDVVRGIRWIVMKTQILFSDPATRELAGIQRKGITRLSFLVQLGFIV